MTEPLKDEIRTTAEGEDEATPARVLFGVALSVWLAAAVILVIAFAVYFIAS
jgi:hypothetical protein